MSLANSDTVDILVETKGGEVLMIITDAREWDNESEHMSLLQKKLNTYVHVLKTVKDPADKNLVIKAISTAKLDTMYGPVDFTMPVDPTSNDVVTHPVPNCLRMPTSSAQWRKGEKWDFEQIMVSSKFLPAGTAVSKVQEMQYS